MGKVLAFVLSTCMASVIVCKGVNAAFFSGLFRDSSATGVCQRDHIQPHIKRDYHSNINKISISEEFFTSTFFLRLSWRVNHEYCYRLVAEFPETLNGFDLFYKLIPIDKRPYIEVTRTHGRQTIYYLGDIIFQYPNKVLVRGVSVYNPNYILLTLKFNENHREYQSRFKVVTRIYGTDEKDITHDLEMQAFVEDLFQYGNNPHDAKEGTRIGNLKMLKSLLQSVSLLKEIQFTSGNPIRDLSYFDTAFAPCVYIPTESLDKAQRFFTDTSTLYF